MITVNQNVKNGSKTALKAIGLVVVLGAALWVGLQGVQNSASIRSALANALAAIQGVLVPRERIVLSVPDSQVVVEEPFALSWEHRGAQEEGTYALSYDCPDNAYLSMENELGIDETVFCGAAREITDETILLTPHGTFDGTEALELRLAFTPEGETDATLGAAIVVEIQSARGVTATTTDTATTTTTVTAPRPVTGGGQTTVVSTFPALTGKADLRIDNVTIGLVDRRTGEFEETDELQRDLPTGKYAAIRFEVENAGTNVTGEWRFSVELPTTPSMTERSDDQPPLFPGDRMIYTLGFNKVRNADSDDYRIRVDVDDDVDESNENNNSESDSVDIDR